MLKDATGTVTVTVNGQDYSTTDIKNGVAEVTVPGLGADEYVATVSYSGNDKYNDNSTTVEFSVSKYVLVPTVSSTEIGDDNKATITVGNLSDATGYVIINVGSDDYPALIDGGEAVVEVSGLVNETNEIVITYDGDYKYESFVNKAQVTRDGKVKLAPSIIVLADSGVAGKAIKVVVILPADATGKVTITVNGTDYETTEIAQGIAAFSDVIIPVSGEFRVNASYSGNDKYLTAANSTTTNIDQVNSTISVENITIKVGENALITVNLPKDATGNVIFSVNNQQHYINNTIVDGVATYSIPGLAYGNHTVDITYEGNGKYIGNTTSCNVEVVKNDVAFNPTTKPIFVGDDAIITVVLPKDATGQVTVTIGTNSSVVEVTGGITNVSVSGLANGTYNAVVEYSGDDKYNSNTSKVDIKVFKISDYDIIIDTEGSIVAGENTTVTITLPKDVNGEITVRINGNEQKVPVNDGKATVVADNVVKGINNITVTYAGDDKYNKGTNSTTFNADAVDAEISIDKNVIPVGDDLVINLPKDAKGTVKVSSGSISYNFDVKDGKAIIPTKSLPAGVYPVNIAYSGDTKYAEKSIKDTVYLQNDW